MDLDFKTHKDLNDFIESNEYIYIVYSEYGCKIGYSKTPVSRMEQIRLGLPSQRVILIGLYLGEKSSIFERYLHNKFRKRKISGEWFNLTETDTDYIDIYLTSRGFKRLIKISLIWSNHLIPSIQIQGKVVTVEKEIKSNPVEVPVFFLEIFEKPTIEDIEIGNSEFMTSRQIQEYLDQKGYKATTKIIGTVLKVLGFDRVSKYDSEVGYSKYGYKVKTRI